MRQPPVRDNTVDATSGVPTGDKTTCPLQWTKHGTLLPCPNFWCAASTYSMEQKPTRTCSKKTHAQRHGTLVVYTQVSSSSQSSQVITREMSHRAGSKRSGSQTVTSFFSSNSRRSTPLTFLRDFCVSTIGRETTSNYPPSQKKKHSIAVELWARPPVLSPALSQVTAPSLCTSARAVARPQKPPQQRSAAEFLGSALLALPPPTRTTPGHRDVAVSAQQPQSNCLFATEKPTTHTPWSERTEEDKCDRKAPVPALRGRRGCKQPATFLCSTSGKNKQQSAVGATVLRDLRGSQSEPLPALLFLRLPQLSGSVLYLFVCDEVALLARPADGLVMEHGTEGDTTPHREGVASTRRSCLSLAARPASVTL